jgi:hypothetical protein
MAAEPKRVFIDDSEDTNLAELLDDADEAPVLINRHGVEYRLSRAESDGWEGYDPERARRVVEEMSGSWSDIDADKLIADIYAWREAGSRPPDRP